MPSGSLPLPGGGACVAGQAAKGEEALTTLGAAGLRPSTGDGVYAAPAPGLSSLWPLGAIAAVLYGALIPFKLDPAAFGLSNGFGLLGIGLHPSGREDLFTNLLVYVPVGLALVLYGRGKGAKRAARIPWAVAVGAGVSILAETLQTGISERIASWTDVGLNTLGTLVGAILGAAAIRAGVSAADQLRRSLADRPFATIAALLTFGLLFFGLAPFDFISDTGALHASFLRTEWSLASFRPPTPGTPPFEALIAKLSGAIWFALLGYFRALSGRESGRHPMIAFASAVKHGLVLVVLVELLQLFTRSHQFDLGALILGFAGVALGAWWAFVGPAWQAGLPVQPVGDRPESSSHTDWKTRPGRAMPTLILALLAVVQVALLLAASVDRHIGFGSPVDLSSVQWIPFEAMWHRPVLKAACAIGSRLVTYAALAITLAIILRRSHVTWAWFLTGAIVTGLALGLEGLQTLTTTRTADLTGPTLALLAAVAVARVYPTLRVSYTAEAPTRTATVRERGGGLARRRVVLTGRPAER